MAGSQLMEQGQDRRRNRAVQSTLAQVGLGELDFDQGMRQLAERGVYTPESEKALRETYQARQEDAIRNPLMAMMQGQNLEGGFAAPLREGEQGPPTPLFMQRSPEGASARLNKFFDEGGPGAIAQFAMLNPAAASAAIAWRNEQGAQQRAQAKAQQDMFKLARDQARDAKLAELVTARMTPGTPLPSLRDLGSEAIQLGAKHEDVWRMLDQSNKIPDKVSTTLMLMGYDGTSLDPTNPTHRGILAAAEKAAIEKESDAFIRQRARLINLAAAAENRKMLKGEAQNFINLDTGEGALGTDSIADLKRKGGRWVVLDAPGRRTIQAANEGKNLIKRLMSYSLGGPADEKAARVLGVPVGTMLPSIYAQTPQNMEEKSRYDQFMEGLGNRLSQKLNITFDVLAQNLPGKQARLVRDTWNAYLAVVGRGIAGDTRFSDHDARRIKDGIASTGIESITRLPDTEDLARSFYESQLGIMEEKIAEALGFNTLGDIADIVRRAPGGEATPGAASAPSTANPAAQPPTLNPAAAPPTTNPAAEPTNLELMQQTQKLIRQYMGQ